MRISSLLRSINSPSGMNLTAPLNSTSEGYVPTQLLETFIPGYGPVHSFILHSLGVDITTLVALAVLAVGGAKLWNYIYTTIYGLVSENLMASVHIAADDDIYLHLMKWLAAQPKIRSSRSLMAETTQQSAWEVDDEEVEKLAVKKDLTGTDSTKFLNFSNQEAKAPPRFIPAFGSHGFWHKGRYIVLRRAKNTVFEDQGPSLAVADKENLVISCFGRSPAPLKELLQDAKDFYLVDHSAMTAIRRPAPKDMRRWGARNCWTQIARRPCRPMETVVLDAERKAEVLADINEYLHPMTTRWYANRGIPYRRGYLFHGPPGTGKTSLAFACAGFFGLDIYCISLLEPTLTEEDLGTLFNALPRRCVVLLEDIDTAGLVRTDKAEDEPESGRTSATSTHASGDEEKWKMVDLAKALKKVNAEAEEDKKKGISLSGLLNAIDGVASHEGRVLVMTTNKPEKLDDALIRPGRVDLQVPFNNAKKSQVQELFERMYTSDMPYKRPNPTDSKTPLSSLAKSPKPEKFKSEKSDPTKTPSVDSSTAAIVVTSPETLIEAEFGLPTRTLSECAEDFAGQIPDGKFSPAEIQGFLLKRKKAPQKACAEVGRWVESMVELKASKTKVLDVQ